MCDGYYDDRVDVWREVERLARKAHKCHACDQAIEAGHRYRVTTVIHDGYVSTWKHCLRCAELIDVLKSRMGEYTTDLLHLDCGEVWDNAPPEIEALAFMTSADAQVFGEAAQG